MPAPTFTETETTFVALRESLRGHAGITQEAMAIANGCSDVIRQIAAFWRDHHPEIPRENEDPLEVVYQRFFSHLDTEMESLLREQSQVGQALAPLVEQVLAWKRGEIEAANREVALFGRRMVRHMNAYATVIQHVDMWCRRLALMEGR